MKELHPPKKLISSIGLGLTDLGNNSDYVSSNIIITTKIWEKLEKPWTQDETIIAQENYKWVTRWELNKPYLLTKIYNDSKELVGIYCDICSPIQREGISFVCYDWYLDVWQPKDSSPVLLDEDELEQAVQNKYLTDKEAQQAKAAAIFLKETLAAESLRE